MPQDNKDEKVPDTESPVIDDQVTENKDEEVIENFETYIKRVDDDFPTFSDSEADEVFEY